MSFEQPEMKIGVCGIACQFCPRMVQGKCPNGQAGCRPRQNEMCQIATCAYEKGVSHCFACQEFPCETTKLGPISYGYCYYIAGRES